MSLCKPHALIATMVFLAGGLAAVPAHASLDFKAIMATECLPYGPGTTVGELTYSQRGITNPGSSNETVICTIPNDGDSAYSTTPGTSATVYAFFRAGAIPGKVACSVYVSNTAIVAGATYTTSVNPANVGANVRSFLTLPLADTSAGWTIAAPTMVLCTITPQATLGGFSFREEISTNTP